MSRPPPRRARAPLPLLAALSLLAACAATPSPAPVSAPAAAAACRAGPDGGPPAPDLAEGERGIGGTGITGTGITGTGITGTRIAGTGPAVPAAFASTEGERGIGGTGITGTDPNGMGIVGVVTGFASICVNGLHVHYDPAQPVAFTDGAATPAALRVGQVVVVQAEGNEAALRARRIAVRHELAGPIEAVEDGALRIAGQRVATAGALPANRRWRVGEAVLVSGLRAPDGTLTATRIDPRPAGAPTLVLGRLSRLGIPRIGNLPLLLRPGLVLPPDGPVIARGRLENGLLLADEVDPDRLMRDPPAYLGTARVLLEAEVGFDDGRLLLGPALSLPATSLSGLALPGRPASLAPGRHVLELHGGPGRPLSVLRTPIGGSIGPSTGPSIGTTIGPAPTGERAPMPDRGFEARRGLERGPGGWSPAARGPRTGGRGAEPGGPRPADGNRPAEGGPPARGR